MKHLRGLPYNLLVDVFIFRACQSRRTFMSSLSSPKQALEIRELRRIAEILDSQEFRKRKVAKIARLTHQLE